MQMRNGMFSFRSLYGFLLFGNICWFHYRISIGFLFFHFTFIFFFLILIENEDGWRFIDLAFLNFLLFLWWFLYLFRIIQRYDHKILIPIILNFLFFVGRAAKLILDFIVIFIF